MDENKRKFIQFLFEKGALKVGGEFSLKSGRLSPWFLNARVLSDGNSISLIGDNFAKQVPLDTDIIFGPAYAAIPLAVATSISLNHLGRKVGYAYDRKEEKSYGESTGKEELQSKILVGSKIKDSDRITIVEDVFTTGQTKYDAINLLNQTANGLSFNSLLIIADREEVNPNSKNAIDEFTAETGIKVSSIISASDVFEFLIEKGMNTEANIMANYLRSYGTEESRKATFRYENPIIKTDRSIIVACDVDTIEELEKIVFQTADIDKIGGYKIGFSLALVYGLPKIVEVIKRHSKKTIIYDHQKSGTDIPIMGRVFARACKNAGVDAIILFPQAGPETERAWIYHAFNEGLGVIVGGRMTHPAYSESEGGFIKDEGAMEIYKIAAQAGIINFVVPGNKPEIIEEIKKLIESQGVINPIFYAPGFITQGGKLSDTAKVAGQKFHGIIGRDIHQVQDIRKAALELTSQI